MNNVKTPRTDALDVDLQHDILSIQSQGGNLSDIIGHVTGNLFKHARTLEQELVELEKDKIRLDWLQNNKSAWCLQFIGENYRQAIDLAISQQEKK